MDHARILSFRHNKLYLMKRNRYQIAEVDVPLFFEAMVAVAQTYEYPWSEHGIRREFITPSSTDLKDPPSAERLSHQLATFFSVEAQKIIKSRVRKARHRSNKEMVCVHLEKDSWKLLKSFASKHNVSMSEAIRRMEALST